MKKIDLKGKFDPALIPNIEYYGNSAKAPNSHCRWISESIIPGWYETMSHQSNRLKTKLIKRMEAREAAR